MVLSQLIVLFVYETSAESPNPTKRLLCGAVGECFYRKKSQPCASEIVCGRDLFLHGEEKALSTCSHQLQKTTANSEHYNTKVYFYDLFISYSLEKKNTIIKI